MKRLLPVALAAALCGCPPPAPPPPPPTPAPTVDPTPPPPTDPEPVTEGDITVTYVNGLRIVVKRIPTAELVAMQLYIRGGAATREAETAGIEWLALHTAVGGGTKTLDKQAFGKRISELGSSLNTATGNSYSVISGKSLTEKVGPTFDLLVDTFLEPALPASEFNLQHQRQLASIAQRDETPDGRLYTLIAENVWKDHPFAVRSMGDQASAAKLTPAMVKDHLAKLRQTSRLQLVVVGNVTADDVTTLVEAKLGKLPRGDFAAPPLPVPSFDAPSLVVEKAELPTNYIEASFIGPRWDDPMFPAAILTMRMLRARVWDEVRTKRNLSYAPSARFAWNSAVTRGSLYVTTVDPNQTMKVMFEEAEKLAETPVEQWELEGAKAVFTTSQLMDNESTNGQASWLALCDVVGDDWRKTQALLDAVGKLTPAEIQAFAEKYLTNFQTVILGPAEELNRSLFEAP